MNVLTNFLSIAPSEFLDYTEAMQALIATGKHRFEFPRNGANSVLWTFPVRLNDHSTFIVDSTVGYGCSEREYHAFIADVIKTAKELNRDWEAILRWGYDRYCDWQRDAAKDQRWGGSPGMSFAKFKSDLTEEDRQDIAADYEAAKELNDGSNKG